LDTINAWDPELHEAIIDTNIVYFEMSYEESVSYFKCLENLEKIRRTNGPSPASLLVDNQKSKFVTSIVGKSSKNHKESIMLCQYWEKNNYNTADCRAVYKLKQRKKARFVAKSGPAQKEFFGLPFRRNLCIQTAVKALKDYKQQDEGIWFVHLQ
jgi:hypothetical protein